MLKAMWVTTTPVTRPAHPLVQVKPLAPAGAFCLGPGLLSYARVSCGQHRMLIQVCLNGVGIGKCKGHTHPSCPVQLARRLISARATLIPAVLSCLPDAWGWLGTCAKKTGPCGEG